ncbi:Biotin--protein ligase [hydrothermal vent metagenome]|uniref:Biotin--protein ligase n=1 Tax=hydrothermal vent metagenome TaxID=652676 RepID=A0A3B0SQ28_9ZZZZ
MIEDIFEGKRPLNFPPLFEEMPVSAETCPFTKACSMAVLGCDSGTLVHCITEDHLRAAIVFAPEMPLARAMAVYAACGTGFQNAFGALAPPEITLDLTWGGDILVNGAKSGRLRVAASTDDPKVEPDWLVVGIEVQLMPRDADDPGLTPDQTCLYEEGCAEMSPVDLLEGWARHTLVWINGLIDGNIAPLHSEWRGFLYGIGEDVERSGARGKLRGKFMGLDEDFGMLIRAGEETTLIPLSDLLKENT